MATLEYTHGLQMDEDEAAIAAMTDEERAELRAYERQWNRMSAVESLREACRICLPIALISAAIIVYAFWGA